MYKRKLKRRDSASKSLSFNRIHLKIFYHDDFIIYLKICRVVIIRSRDRDPSLVIYIYYFILFYIRRAILTQTNAKKGLIGKKTRHIRNDHK